MSLFNEINKEAEEKELANQKAITELPEAYQVMTTEVGRNQNGTVLREVVVDTYAVDKVKGIVPKGKAMLKAKKMKEVYPDKTFYVVEIVNRIVATY
jgi:hypothetical protein